jgi:hypothetical protein
MYGLFFDRQNHLHDWVMASQRHQAWVIDLMTRAFRRDRRMVSFAVHLLIDAFPAGWMKALVDCERRPKPAWHAYREALAPVLADLRLDRWHWWGGETLTAEAWVCNDTLEPLPGARLVLQLEVAGTVRHVSTMPAQISPDTPVCQGQIRLPLPEIANRTPARLRLGLRDGEGRLINVHDVDLQLFPRAAAPPLPGTRVIGGGGSARRLAEDLALPSGDDLLLIDDAGAFAARREEILARVEAGARAVFLELMPSALDLPGGAVHLAMAGMEPRIFVSRATGHPWVAEFEPEDFRFWHRPDQDRPGTLLETLFDVPEGQGWRPVLTTVQGGWGRSWTPALACAERSLGQGCLAICQVQLAGRLATNPVARLFATTLLAAPTQ